MFRYDFKQQQSIYTRCPMCRDDESWAESYCWESGDDCEGKLDDRPDWCPLKDLSKCE